MQIILHGSENTKKKVRIILPLFIIPLLLMVSFTGITQELSYESVRFLFYNTENLFDPFDDSLTMDDEFTPAGLRHWTYDRFQDKLLKISKVIVSAGDWSSPPALVGLCEVENAWVLQQMVDETPLARYNYHYVHHESPDRRGIDVAFLYNPDVFRITGDEPVRIILENEGETTRDILYVRGLLWDSVTIHVFINHWPSRWQGTGVSKPKRMKAAMVLRQLVDTLFDNYQDPLIIIAGDFNDDIDDSSLSDCLGVKQTTDLPDNKQLYLLEFHKEDGIYGTARYQAFWYEFDHIIVSGALLHSNLLRVAPAGEYIHHPGFLLEEDKSFTGFVPSRTYRGYRYHGGFSDHLPVYIDLQRRY